MELIYNGVSILKDTKPMVCKMTDYAGGQADFLEVMFSDVKHQWTDWLPKRGDSIELVEGYFKSGVLFVDDLDPQMGAYRIFAVSVPLEARKIRTKIWRNVSIREIAGDIASRSGLTLESYYIQNHNYFTVTQRMETDISFLTRICLREGYGVKVSDRKLILYGEKEMEGQAASITIEQSKARPDYTFQRGTELLSSYQVVYALFGHDCISQKVIDKDIAGGAGYRVEPCTSIGEAQRFAYGYLRAANKESYTAQIPLLSLTSVAAGSTVSLTGFGFEEDGNWFVSAVMQDAVNQKTTLQLRKSLPY